MTMSYSDRVAFERVQRVPLLALVLVLILLGSVPATVINVPADRTTIQDGIDYAGTGDTVLVAPGYYLENIDFRGRQIVVSSHFLLNQNPDFIFTTTIDGSAPQNSDSATTVRIFCTGTEVPVFQGFTVTGGHGTRMYDPAEGLYFRNGGGIATVHGAPIIRFNYIHHNQPSGTVDYGGGGIYLQRGSPVIENNIIVSNPGKYGSGLCVRDAQVTARNNLMALNYGGTSFGGSGIYLYEGELHGYNNTIAFNSSQQPGSGVRVAQGNVYLSNSILWGNTGPGSAQTYVDGTGLIAMEYSDVQGGYAGVGNIDADPVFTGSWYFTGSNSPCVDAGDPDASQNDLAWPSAPQAARWPSRGGLRNDMGACGGPGCYPLEMAAITVSEKLGWVPLEVGFEAESYFVADGWSWEFDDGHGASGQAVVHTYEEPGAHDVTLIINHDGGQTYSFTREALVYALADTMSAAEVRFAPTMPIVPVEVVIQANNNAPLEDIYIPFTYSGDLELVYDGFTTSGYRTADLEYQWEILKDLEQQTVVVELTGSVGLPLGSGPILKLLFYAVAPENGQSATISLSSELFPDGPQFVTGGLTYRPGTLDGSVYCDCCTGRVGDANGSGGDDPTIGDVSQMIDALFITASETVLLTPPACIDEADVNLSSQNSPAHWPPVFEDITIGDISALIDALFITADLSILPNCP